MPHILTDQGTSWKNAKGETAMVANFQAKIIEEHRYVDGEKLHRVYKIKGWKGDEELPPLVVTSDDFAKMGWHAGAWGSSAIIMPSPNAKDLLRTAIQLTSEPTIHTIYTHTGWTKIDGKNYFLTNGRAIGPDDSRDDIQLHIPKDLQCYQLPAPTDKSPLDMLTAMQKHLPAELAWLLIATIFRAPLQNTDFVTHITGRTGTFKSEIGAIAQSFTGACEKNDLPAAWSSTANAIEALAYKSKDVPFVVDDFIPSGTSYQVKAYQTTADRVVRSATNGTGRQRLTDTSGVQETMHPRSAILSTGEDTPEGHSVRGRMMIIEMSPEDIKCDGLTEMQNLKVQAAQLYANYIQWLAQDLPSRKAMLAQWTKEERAKNLGVGHSRTPTTLAAMIATIDILLMFLQQKGGLSAQRATKAHEKAVEVLTRLAHRQKEYLTAADPVDQFLSTLRTILALPAGHLKTVGGGIPEAAPIVGWRDNGEGGWLPTGSRLGWVDKKNDCVYLDAAVCYDTIRRHSRGAITITRQTLFKRLREGGALAKVDDHRQRNTIRITCEAATRTVIAVKLPLIMEGHDHE